jgi:hypothetical protein
MSSAILQQLPDFDGALDMITPSLNVDLGPEWTVGDHTFSAELDIPGEEYFDNLLISAIEPVAPDSPAMSTVSPSSSPATNEKPPPSSVLRTPPTVELAQAPAAMPEAPLLTVALPLLLPPAMLAFLLPPALAPRMQKAPARTHVSSEVMAQAAAESLLDAARTAAAKAKLELRKSLKADLSKRKGTLTVAQRSKLRSRREAAVSRQNKITYASQLEELVRALVYNNLKRVGTLESAE